MMRNPMVAVTVLAAAGRRSGWRCFSPLCRPPSAPVTSERVWASSRTVENSIYKRFGGVGLLENH